MNGEREIFRSLQLSFVVPEDADVEIIWGEAHAKTWAALAIALDSGAVLKSLIWHAGAVELSGTEEDKP